MAKEYNPEEDVMNTSPKKATKAKKEKAPMVQTAMESQSILTIGVEVPGIAFRWINGDVRNQMQNWRHWSVVERDTELGEKVATTLDGGHSKFGGGNEGNYFSRGSLVLAWAPEEAAQAYRDKMDAKADDRLRQVVTGGTTLRHTYISEPRK